MTSFPAAAAAPGSWGPAPSSHAGQADPLSGDDLTYPPAQVLTLRGIHALPSPKVHSELRISRSDQPALLHRARRHHVTETESGRA